MVQVSSVWRLSTGTGVLADGIGLACDKEYREMYGRT